MLGAAAPWATAAVVAALYLVAARMAAKSPDLPHDIDIDNPQRARYLADGARRACTSCCRSAR